MILTEFGVVFNQGKDIFTWDQFLEVVTMVSNAKTTESLKKAITDRVSFDQMKLFQEMDKERLNKFAMELGLKDQSNNSYKTIKSNINRKLEKFAPEKVK